MVRATLAQLCKHLGGPRRQIPDAATALSELIQEPHLSPTAAILTGVTTCQVIALVKVLGAPHAPPGGREWGSLEHIVPCAQPDIIGSW